MKQELRYLRDDAVAQSDRHQNSIAYRTCEPHYI